MKTFSDLMEATSYEQHKKRVSKIAKGSTVSFTHSQTGKTVSGQYKGLKNMGGRSYAHVEHGNGATYVPVHQIHESVDLGEAETVHHFRTKLNKAGDGWETTHNGKDVTHHKTLQAVYDHEAKVAPTGKRTHTIDDTDDRVDNLANLPGDKYKKHPLVKLRD